MVNKYMSLAQHYASRSLCKKRQVGCVVVKDNEVIAYGFNHGYTEQCECSMTHKNPDVIHAEQMALSGTDDVYKGSTLFVTYQPCLACAELIISKGITTVYFIQEAKTPDSIHYLNQHSIEVSKKY